LTSLANDSKMTHRHSTITQLIYKVDQILPDVQRRLLIIRALEESESSD
jgi:hypothetical protein